MKKTSKIINSIIVGLGLLLLFSIMSIDANAGVPINASSVAQATTSMIGIPQDNPRVSAELEVVGSSNVKGNVVLPWVEGEDVGNFILKFNGTTNNVNANVIVKDVIIPSLGFTTCNVGGFSVIREMGIGKTKVVDLIVVDGKLELPCQ